jgi:hypothetical protein
MAVAYAGFVLNLFLPCTPTPVAHSAPGLVLFVDLEPFHPIHPFIQERCV